MSLTSIVKAIGGDLYAGGLRANVPAPGHSPLDRSVSLLLDGERVVIHTFNGADWREVLADLQARGLVDGAGRLVGQARIRGLPAGAMAPSRRTKQARTASIWEEGRPIVGTLSERHARRRRITGQLPEALRHHPQLAASAYLDLGPRRPALLAAVLDEAGVLCAVEATYLAPNGERAALRLPRKTLGFLPPGCAVRLDAAAPRLIVGEGVFTTLSARDRFHLPGWALLSTTNLRSWRPPPEVRSVLIAADRGADGEASAALLARRLGNQGVQTSIVLPPSPWNDWNEAAPRPDGPKP